MGAQALNMENRKFSKPEDRVKVNRKKCVSEKDRSISAEIRRDTNGARTNIERKRTFARND